MVDRIKKLEKVKGCEMKEGKEERLEKEKGRKKLEEKMKDIEKKMELRQGIERRNIMVRSLEIKEREETEAFEQVMKEIGAEVEVKDISRVESRQEGKEIWLVRLSSEEQKREVIRRKKILKGKKELRTT